MGTQVRSRRPWTTLGGKYYFMTRYDQQSAVGHTDGQPGRPREWAVTLKRKF